MTNIKCGSECLPSFHTFGGIDFHIHPPSQSGQKTHFWKALSELIPNMLFLSCGDAPLKSYGAAKFGKMGFKLRKILKIEQNLLKITFLESS